MAAPSRDDMMESGENIASGKKDIQEQRCQMTKELVDGLVQDSNLPLLVENAQKIRKLLAKEPRPPIDEVIQSGLLPRFVQLLQRADQAILQFEIASILTSLASGSPQQTKTLLDAGVASIFIRLIESPHPDVREQSIWAIGNFAGDCSECRDFLLNNCTHLNHVIVERLPLLRDQSVKQIFCITRQLMKSNAPTVETVCSNLVRQAAGGDLSARNLWFIENLLDIFIENRAWLTNSSAFMTPTIIYTFLRLISDHLAPAQSSLRQKEADYLIGLIRERFHDCLVIGRDFLRLLHNVIKMPEFEKLWHDIFNNPTSLNSTFTNPLQLLAYRTPRRLLQSRLTFEMEKKISFLATQVKFGNEKPYQVGFHKQYLSTPESLSLRCDLIRYICAIIHPSNEVLCSDIIPRWAIIGWLLSTCTTSASAVASRLALFTDYLLYDVKSDNIMNIEPAILVMYHSTRMYPHVTSSLLDFLCRMPNFLSSKLSESIKAHIKKALQHILEKRVIPSLAPLFDNPKHDPALRALIRETFPEFWASNGQFDNGISQLNTTMPTQGGNHQNVVPQSAPIPVAANNPPPKQQEVIFIDHEKSVSSNEAVLTNSCEIQNKSNQDTNHINNRSADQPSNQNDDKLSPSSSRHETKSSTNNWNNLDGSQKHSHDKSKKLASSLTSTGASDTSRKAPNLSTEIVPGETMNNSKSPTTPCTSTLQSRQDTSTAQSTEVEASHKVIYPFMTVPEINFKEIIHTFSEPIRYVLETLKIERRKDNRCSLMDKLISLISDSTEASLKELGHCIAQLIVDDFSSKILPSSSHDNKSLKDSLSSPLFVLCRSAFNNRIEQQQSKMTKTMHLLVNIFKCYEATGFLIMYYMRVNAILASGPAFEHYQNFCSAARRELDKALYDDLHNASLYDPELFSFLLPSIFGELASAARAFNITGNIELVHLVVSTLDPIHLQELICLCSTGTTKVIPKDNVIPLIEASLNWNSWEQYYLWKLVAAQSVPIENLISIIPKLDSKSNPEAISCIMLNLMKVSEPSSSILRVLLSCDLKPSDHFISSILRHWTLKTDVKELASIISQLSDTRPSSPPVKRKGQAKTSTKLSTGLSSFSEKILCHLDSIRLSKPKNKLLLQAEILDLLTNLEAQCNDCQKKKFADLFANRPKPTKKQRKMD